MIDGFAGVIVPPTCNPRIASPRLEYVVADCWSQVATEVVC